jgi:hypothetical protein
MALRPTCLTDGRYLVEFYILYSADDRYNATNQRYWLQYHTKGDLLSPSITSDMHLIRPSDTLEALAARHHFMPFRQWITLTYESVYIHGPFEFAMINGRRSRDRVSLDDWTILHGNKHLYTNLPPSLVLPTYSVHCDQGVHIAFESQSVSETLLSVATETSNNGERVIP